MSQKCFTPLPSCKVHPPKRIIYKNHRVDENTKRDAKHGEIPFGRLKLESRPGRPTIFRQKRFVTFSKYTHFVLSPVSSGSFTVFSFSSANCDPLVFHFSSFSHRILRLRSLLSFLVRSFHDTRSKDEQTKPQIYNLPVAMRIIIEYQKLCYSLFHSAHLLPAWRFRGPAQ